MTEQAPTTQTPIYDRLMHEWTTGSVNATARHRRDTDALVDVEEAQPCAS